MDQQRAAPPPTAVVSSPAGGRRGNVVIGSKPSVASSAAISQWTLLFPELGTEWPSHTLPSSSSSASSSSAPLPSSSIPSAAVPTAEDDAVDVIGVKIVPAEGEEVVKPSAVSGGKGDLGAVSDADGEPRMTLQALQSQVVGQAEAAKQRRRRRMQQLRKGDSALALGLFESFFNLEVRVPGTGVKQIFLIPHSYSVDQVKNHIFKYGDGFDSFSIDEFQLGVSEEERLRVEFAVFAKAHPSIVEALKHGEAVTIQLFPTATATWTGDSFRRRSQTLRKMEAEAAENGSRIKRTAEKYGGSVIVGKSKTASEALITQAVRNAQAPVTKGGSWRQTRPTSFFGDGALGAELSALIKNNSALVVCNEGYAVEIESMGKPRAVSDAPYKIHPINTQELRLEQTIYDMCAYNQYFYSKRHVNFGGVHNREGPVVVSILKTPISEEQEAPSSDGPKPRDQRYRVLIWTKYGERQAVVSLSQRLLSKGRPPGKRLLKALQQSNPSFLGEVEFYRLDPAEKISEELLEMELKQVVSNFKFGILYAKDGQIKEQDMFSNEHGSQTFENFLTLIGEKVVLEGWSQYRAGLDVRYNATGTHSIYTTWQDYEIMFHVSTYLPYDGVNRQQLERKRHLGNDIVVLIFCDGSTPFLSNTIKSEFNHVFIIVQPITMPDGSIAYRVGTTYKEGVRRFKPLLPDPNEYVLEHGPAFREFLLTKLINAERACYYAPSFDNKIKRTKFMLLESLLSNYPQVPNRPTNNE